MHFSRLFKSSPYCSVSPDGRLIATLSSTTINIRSSETLQAFQAVKLPLDLRGSPSSLVWSPSSTRLLVAAGDQIRVFSLTDASSHATIRNSVASGKKPSLVQFGAHDGEILVCSAFGLKFVIIDLSTSKAVEVNNPKLYLSSTAARGFALRPESGHLALLTRDSGRDMISIHDPTTRQVQRSWQPETNDAQGLSWTPDGKWLFLWESAAHGHKLLLYASDGEFIRSIDAASLVGGKDALLAPGIKLCQSSPDAALMVVTNYSRTAIILDTRTWRVALRLLHPTTVTPKNTLQVWQEQINNSVGERPTHTFLRATQAVSPPGYSSDGKQVVESRVGCSLAAFDASSTLLATRLDDSPGAVWIWDVASAELRAALIFHSSVSFCWHPFVPELLLLTCQDEAYTGISSVWDPLSSGPKYISVKDRLPNEEIMGKPLAAWVGRNSDAPTVLLSDAQRYVMVSCTDAETCPASWRSENESERMKGSSLESLSSIIKVGDDRDISAYMEEDDTSPLDDTFSFKNT